MSSRKGFSRSARITQGEVFARVKRQGCRARSGPLIVSYVTGQARRLGVVVPRHVGCAVKRNRIRRRVREFFRNNRESFPCGDCVIVACEGAADLSSNEAAEHLVRAIARLGA